MLKYGESPKEERVRQARDKEWFQAYGKVFVVWIIVTFILVAIGESLPIDPATFGIETVSNSRRNFAFSSSKADKEPPVSGLSSPE